MAPTAISVPLAEAELAKAKNAPTAYRNDTWKKPVADNYLYDFKYNFPLPTHGKSGDILDFTEEESKNLQAIAEEYVKDLGQIIQRGDSSAFARLFLDIGESLCDVVHVSEQLT